MVGTGRGRGRGDARIMPRGPILAAPSLSREATQAMDEPPVGAMSGRACW